MGGTVFVEACSSGQGLSELAIEDSTKCIRGESSSHANHDSGRIFALKEGETLCNSLGGVVVNVKPVEVENSGDELG